MRPTPQADASDTRRTADEATAAPYHGNTSRSGKTTFSKHFVRQFTAFATAGAIGTGAHYLVLVVLVSSGRLGAIGASAAGFVTGALINYFLNYRYVFRSDKRHKEALVKFFSVALIGLAVNSLVIGLAVGWLGVHYLIAQVAATGCVLLCTFFGNRAWTFR